MIICKENALREQHYVIQPYIHVKQIILVLNLIQELMNLWIHVNQIVLLLFQNMLVIHLHTLVLKVILDHTKLCQLVVHLVLKEPNSLVILQPIHAQKVLLEPLIAYLPANQAVNKKMHPEILQSGWQQFLQMLGELADFKDWLKKSILLYQLLLPLHGLQKLLTQPKDSQHSVILVMMTKIWWNLLHLYPSLEQKPVSTLLMGSLAPKKSVVQIVKFAPITLKENYVRQMTPYNTLEEDLFNYLGILTTMLILNSCIMMDMY